MKLLWLCNMAPGIAREKMGAGGLWIDHVLSDLRKRQDITLRVLFPGNDGKSGAPDDRLSYAAFAHGAPYDFRPQQEVLFEAELKEFQPDVIHIWGTEYAHTLAMVNAAEKSGLLDRLVVSIQGLCSEISKAYVDGISEKACSYSTFRDFLRKDNIVQQQKKFALRGELEVEALRKVRHVIGRTPWDKACMEKINPQARYHFCNETLREPFYEGCWQYDSCQKHRIFASSCLYPVKGFHYLLEAFGHLVKKYPAATLAVTGRSFFAKCFKEKLRQSGYQKYLAELARKYGLEERIEFLGSLNAQQMKENYLQANVFVLPSTIENSPNSLGEAMLLGTPCVASDVGGVTAMMVPEQEGFAYQSTALYMLAHHLDRVFAMEAEAATLGQAAAAHAVITHDPETNLKTLLSVYESLK